MNFIDVYKNDLLIGVDAYLGESHPDFYMKYDYLRHRSDPRFIVPDAFEFWITSLFLDYNLQETFLDEMVYKGKVMYLMSKILEDLSDPDIFRYTQKDFDWCNNNEYNIWRHLLKMEILYHSDSREFQSFFYDF